MGEDGATLEPDIPELLDGNVVLGAEPEAIVHLGPTMEEILAGVSKDLITPEWLLDIFRKVDTATLSSMLFHAQCRVALTCLV